MLNKLNFAVARAAGDGAWRSAMACIRITADATTATNGHWLARVTRPRRGDGVGLLPAAAARELHARLKPYSHGDWDRVQASFAPETGKITVVQPPGVHCGALREDAYEAAAGDFPAVDIVIADSRARKTAAEAIVSAKYLQELADLVLAGASPGEKRSAQIRIRLVRDSKAGVPQPVEFHAEGGEGQAIFALLMPCRADGEPLDAGGATAPGPDPGPQPGADAPAAHSGREAANNG